ncbi:MAG: hypothetical protein GY758_35435 [Fuerstiella sp.]|nr:hypothetical protein [Fuerstiella sp.]MCP4508553.1 hypothetical protein [Fuerstiella sp.]
MTDPKICPTHYTGLRLLGSAADFASLAASGLILRHPIAVDNALVLHWDP